MEAEKKKSAAKKQMREAIGTVKARLKPVVEKVVGFWNTRNKREKTMLLVFGAVFILCLDYWIFVRPISNVFSVTVPQLAQLDAELQGLRDDKKNAQGIQAELEETRERLAERENTFVTRDRVPAMLEELSKLALDSGVKIIALRPVGSVSASTSKNYPVVTVSLQALAGTHEFGEFLARLESGPTFFRVRDLTVGAQDQDIRRHRFDVNLETYTRTEGRSKK